MGSRLLITSAASLARLSTFGRRVGSRPELTAVLVIGMAVRLVLLPITRGQDFVVWDEASAATLRGSNVYAHHPNYPGGPFAYFPLFLYVELPFQWLSQHIGVSFTVLGKLPMLAADIGVAVLIAGQLRERNCRPAVAAVGAALFFLNPLVIYNSAYYGRFDSVGCVLLMLAVRGFLRGRTGPAGLWYALAVTAKTFPVFVLPAVLRAARGARIRTALVLAAVTLALSAPYLGTWRPFLHDIVVYDATKTPQFLSWQRLLLHVMDGDEAGLAGYLLLGLFALGAVVLGRFVGLERAVGLTLLLFLVCSKVVLDQYLIWPLPWLILAIWTPPRPVARASAAMVLVLTSLGMFANATIHPWGRSTWWLEVGLALCCGCYLLVALTPRSAQQRVFPATTIAGPPTRRGPG